MPTALELSREEWKRYSGRAGGQREQRMSAAPSQEEREALLARLRKVAEVLRSQFGVERVVLFGSLAHEAWYDPGSDVDLAVWGLAHHAYWQAWGAVEEIIKDRTVDLIQFESAPRPLQTAIERKSVEL